MRLLAILTTTAALFGAATLGGCTASRAADDAPASTVRNNIELTVYKQDFGMVREVRPVQLVAGANQIRLPEVSRALDPQSVLLRWSGGGGAMPRLVAHSYDLGVSSSGDLLKRYLGREVELVRYGENGRQAERTRGTLMVSDGGDVVLRTRGRFFVNPEGTLVMPADDELVTIPQLSLQVESPAAGPNNLDMAYLTRGLSWSADYVATLDPNQDFLALDCWATVTNRTGVNYPEAQVMLIAGTPNRATRTAAERAPAAEYDAQNMYGRNAFMDGRSKRDSLAPGVTAEAVGDFHAYQIEKPTTIVQEQMNRLLILSSASVPVKKDYNSRLPRLGSWNESYYWTKQPQRGPVQVALIFFNREEDGLGTPLPQGALRVYEPDSSGSLRYGGAAEIRDTPKDQKVDVTLARVFDLFTEYRLVSTKRLDKRTVRKQVEVVLHNQKAGEVTLRLVQRLSGGWKIVKSSHKHQKLDAYNVQWQVPVPAGGEVTLAYTVDLPR